MALLVSMISSHGVILTFEYVETLWEKYDFQQKDGVFLPLDRTSFLEPPLVKVGVYANTFDVPYRVPTTGFLNKGICSFDQLLLMIAFPLPTINFLKDSLLLLFQYLHTRPSSPRCLETYLALLTMLPPPIPSEVL
ncbi:unnamed protein product [Lactuca saligna]|uniref:Uncharacterized protein n=1 Tax=Lactuca saligna TaxID=75948 RepID=A0AA35UXT3_LACSI|nr:unnamed protein product [Lactuca saligna]